MGASWHRLRALIRKEILQILRDPNSLVIALLIPIIELFLLGYAATHDVRNVPLVVVDADRRAAARELVDAYRATDAFQVVAVVVSEDAMREYIYAGKARAALVLPPDYTDQVRTNGTATVAFIIDGSEPTTATRVLSAAQLIAQHHGAKLQQRRLERMGVGSPQPPLEMRLRVWYNPDLKDAYFMIPGLIGTILYALTSVLTANAIVRERERGTIEQLIVTPIRSWELVVGKIAPYVLIAFVDTLEVLFIGSVWFGVPIRSPLPWIILLSGLFLISGLGVGLWASAMAHTQQEAMLLTWMTFLPAIFLSGFIFPIEAMPKALQIISYIFPLRYYLVIIRTLLLKGVHLQALMGDILALMAFGLFIMAAAALRFRKRLE